MATLDLPNTGTSDDAGDGDVIRVAHTKHNANVSAVNTQLDTLATGSGLDPSGHLQADPTSAAAALAAGMSIHEAVWQVYRNQAATPANVKVQAAAWDASTNVPDLSQATNQGETDAEGDWVGYEWTVGTEGTQDIGGGSTLFRPGDTVLFAAAATPLHRDNSPSVISHGVVTGAQTLPAATGSGVMHLYVLDPSGAAVTVAPASGEQVNGTVDRVMAFDGGSSVVQAVDVAAGQWVVGPNSVSTKNNAIIADTGHGMSPASLTAANTWNDMNLPVLGGLQSGDTVTVRFGGGDSVSGVVDETDGTLVMQRVGAATTVQVRTVAGAFQLASTDASLGLDRIFVQRFDGFHAGTLIPEPVRDLLVTSTAGSGGSITIPSQAALQAAGYEFVEIDLEAHAANGQQFQYNFRRRVSEGFSLARFYESDGGSTLGITFNAAGTVGTMQYSGSFSIAGRHHVYGVRPQFNAIRAEDAQVVEAFYGVYRGTTGDFSANQQIASIGTNAAQEVTGSAGVTNNGNGTFTVAAGRRAKFTAFGGATVNNAGSLMFYWWSEPASPTTRIGTTGSSYGESPVHSAGDTHAVAILDGPITVGLTSGQTGTSNESCPNVVVEEISKKVAI